MKDTHIYREEEKEQAPQAPEEGCERHEEEERREEGLGRGEREGQDSPFAHIEHKKKRRFLELYTDCGNVSLAAAGAGISRFTHYSWMKSDPVYKKAFEEDAQAILLDNLEAEMYRRACHGVEKPVFYKGERVDIIREYSDVLAIFLAKGAKPEKYNERVVQEHVGARGGPILLSFVEPETVRAAEAEETDEGTD